VPLLRAMFVTRIKNQLDNRTNSCHRNDIKLHVNLTCLNACMYVFMHGLYIDWRVWVVLEGKFGEQFFTI
jgi:hypothetical protein